MIKVVRQNLLDRRVVDRYIAKGLISQAEVTKHLGALSDETENGEWVNMELLDADLGPEAVAMDSADDEDMDEDLDSEEDTEADTAELDETDENPDRE